MTPHFFKVAAHYFLTRAKTAQLLRTELGKELIRPVKDWVGELFTETPEEVTPKETAAPTQTVVLSEGGRPVVIPTSLPTPLPVASSAKPTLPPEQNQQQRSDQHSNPPAALPAAPPAELRP